MILESKENEYKILTEIWEDSVRATHTFLEESHINFFRPKILNEYLYAVKLYVYKDEFGNILGFIGIDENKVEMLFIKSKYFEVLYHYDLYMNHGQHLNHLLFEELYQLLLVQLIYHVF